MDTYEIILNVIMALGGLGLFLIGMKYMGEGLELAAGSKLRVMLQKITSNKFIAMMVGLLVTAVIQSSSATDAMVVGFVNAGLMDIYQSIGILFGSKIGTTATSLLLSIDIKAFVPIFTFVGAVVITFAKKNNYRYYGQIAAGFGILFMGMDIMSENFDFLKDSQVFINTVSALSNPLHGVGHERSCQPVRLRLRYLWYERRRVYACISLCRRCKPRVKAGRAVKLFDQPVCRAAVFGRGHGT